MMRRALAAALLLAPVVAALASFTSPPFDRPGRAADGPDGMMNKDWTLWQVASAMVERVWVARGGTYSPPSFYRDNRAELVRAKASLLSIYTNFVRYAYISGGTVDAYCQTAFPSSAYALLYTNKFDFLQDCGLPTNWFDKTPWRSLDAFGPATTSDWCQAGRSNHDYAWPTITSAFSRLVMTAHVPTVRTTEQHDATFYTNVTQSGADVVTETTYDVLCTGPTETNFTASVSNKPQAEIGWLCDPVSWEVTTNIYSGGGYAAYYGECNYVKYTVDATWTARAWMDGPTYGQWINTYETYSDLYEESSASIVQIVSTQKTQVITRTNVPPSTWREYAKHNYEMLHGATGSLETVYVGNKFVVFNSGSCRFENSVSVSNIVDSAWIAWLPSPLVTNWVVVNSGLSTSGQVASSEVVITWDGTAAFDSTVSADNPATCTNHFVDGTLSCGGDAIRDYYSSGSAHAEARKWKVKEGSKHVSATIVTALWEFDY